MVKISVIITTYNQEKYIGQAIESVLAQKDCPEFEIIIGNDASTDSTQEIIEEYQAMYPKKIKVIEHPINVGMQYNLNYCFKNCSGLYVAICEGDDYWCDPYKLKKQYQLLRKSKKALFCFTDIYIKNEIANKTKLQRHLNDTKAKLHNDFTFENLVENQNPVANFSCCMYKKRALKLIPDEYWRSKEADFLFNMYILNHSNGIFLKDICSVYRINSNSQWSSMDCEKINLDLISRIIKYNEIFEFNHKKSFYILLEKIIQNLNKNSK